MSENLEPITADDVVWGKTYYEMNKVDAVISEKNKEINGWKAGYSNLLNVDIPRIEINLKNKIAQIEENHKKEVEQLLILNREQNNRHLQYEDSMKHTILRLKRALYKALASWAEAEIRRRYGGYPHEGNSWFKMKTKCLTIAAKLKESI